MKKNAIITSIICLAVLIIIVCAFLKTNERKKEEDVNTANSANTAEDDTAILQGQTSVISDEEWIYTPSENEVSYDKDKNRHYYNDELIVFLNDDLSKDDAENFVKNAGGTLIGRLTGSVKILQIGFKKSTLSDLKKKSEQIMKSDFVTYCCFDFPSNVEATAITNSDWDNDTNENEPDGDNWWAEAIGAYTAWNYDYQLQTPITVGIIDSGFQLDHPDMLNSDGTSKVSMLNNFLQNSPSDHGTFDAGIIGASDNDIGIRGVSFPSSIVGFDYVPQDNDYYNEDGTRSLLYELRLDSTWLNLVISQMIDQNVRVINCSFGMNPLPTLDGYATSLTEEEFNRKYDNNDNNMKKEKKSIKRRLKRNKQAEYNLYIEELRSEATDSGRMSIALIEGLLNSGNNNFIIVQGAGNGYGNGGYKLDYGEAKGNKAYECHGFFCSVTQDIYNQYREAGGTTNHTFSEIKDHIMIVGATGYPDKNQNILVSYSNFGDAVDIVAPGGNNDGNNNHSVYGLLTTHDGNQYGYMCGTSMSTPMVAGAAAYIWSINPDLSAAEVKNALIENSETASPYADYDTRSSYPMLNVGEATKAIISGDRVLEKYAQDQQYTCGHEYNTYVRKNDNSENPYQYDLSEIPTTNMGYQVYDFDGDGQNELLVVKIKSDYSLQLDMYEYENGTAELSASWDAEDQTHYYEDDDSIHVARGLPGHLDCFIYEEEDNIRIALEENYSGVVASGTSICFSVVEYNNNTFNEAGGEFIIGSGLLEEDGTEFKNGIEKLGAKGVVFEDIWEGNSEVIDYMPSVHEICRQDSALLLSTGELIELSENGIDKPVTNVKFLSRDELFTGNGKYYGTQQSSSEGDTNSDNIYESETVKNNFLAAVSGTWECRTRGVPDHPEAPEWTATFSEDKINYTDYSGYEYSVDIAHVVSTDEGYLIQCISDNGSHFAYLMSSDCTSTLYVDGWEVTSTNTHGDEGMVKTN